MHFTTSLDWIAKTVTIFVTLLFAAIALASFGYFSLPGQNVGPGALPVISILLIAAYVFCLMQFPRGYTVTLDQLIVHKFVGKRVIALDKIKAAFFVKPEELKWSIRTFGSGGLFGYFGRFYNSKYGDMTWYATRISHFVMIELKDGGHIVLTPDQDGLEAALKPDVQATS